MKRYFTYLFLAIALCFGTQQAQASLVSMPIEPTAHTTTKASKLTRKERQEVRQQLKNYKAAAQQASPDAAQSDSKLILSVILAILIPCLGVYVWQGSVTIDFWISLILMLLFYIPGLIYALYVILAK